MAEFRLTPPRDLAAMGALYGASDDPMWMQSAMMNAPRGVRPTVPIDLEQSEPGAAAAYRMQQAVRPDFGRPGNGPTVRDVFNATPTGLIANYAPKIIDMLTDPGSPAMRDIEIPRTSSGRSVAEILGGSAEAADDPNAPKAQSVAAAFGEPEPKRQSEIQAAIDAVNKTVDAQRKQLEALGRSLARGVIDKKEYEQRRIGPEAAIGRADAKIKEIDAPFQRDLSAWETRRNTFLTDQSTAKQQLEAKKANAELPFRIKHPEATQAIIGGGNALTGATALVTGLLSRGKLKPTLGATGIGAAEGAVTGNIPELLDLGGYQPKGGPGWQKTREEFFSPDNLIKTGAEAGLHAAGAAGISYGASLGPKVMGRLGEYGRNVRGAFSGGRVPPETPLSPPPSMEGLPSGPSAGNPMQSAPSMPPIPQGMPGMMSAPSTLPVPEPLPPPLPVRARAPRAAPREQPAIEPILTPLGWQDPITGKLIAPPPMIR